MSEDTEISAARRPAGKGWWVDGRCGLVMLGLIAGTLLFSIAFSFRAADAAFQSPGFVAFMQLCRIVCYLNLGLVTAPFAWALKRAAWFAGFALALDAMLLAVSFQTGADITQHEAGPLASPTLRLLALLAAPVLGLTVWRASTRTFAAGVETTRLYGRGRRT